MREAGQQIETPEEFGNRIAGKYDADKMLRKNVDASQSFSSESQTEAASTPEMSAVFLENVRAAYEHFKAAIAENSFLQGSVVTISPDGTVLQAKKSADDGDLRLNIRAWSGVIDPIKDTPRFDVFVGVKLDKSGEVVGDSWGEESVESVEQLIQNNDIEYVINRALEKQKK